MFNNETNRPLSETVALLSLKVVTQFKEPSLHDPGWGEAGDGEFLQWMEV